MVSQIFGEISIFNRLNLQSFKVLPAQCRMQGWPCEKLAIVQKPPILSHSTFASSNFCFEKRKTFDNFPFNICSLEILVCSLPEIFFSHYLAFLGSLPNFFPPSRWFGFVGRQILRRTLSSPSGPRSRAGVPNDISTHFQQSFSFLLHRQVEDTSQLYFLFDLFGIKPYQKKQAHWKDSKRRFSKILVFNTLL